MTVAEAAFAPTLTRASAGTGKTHELSTRLIALLAAGFEPDGILATTFTRKAAGEIRDRVLHRLADAAESEKAARQLTDAIAEHLGNGAAVGNTPHPLDRPRARELLGTLLQRLHRLNIGTLDSFFLRIAGGFPLELGLPPAWRIADEQTIDRLRNDAVRATLSPGAGGTDHARLIELIRLLSPGELRRSVHDQVLRVVGELHELHRQQPDPAAWDWLRPPKPLDEAELQQRIEALGHLQDELPQTKDGRPNKSWANAVHTDRQNARNGEWEQFVGSGIAGKIAAGDQTFSRKPIPEAVVEAYRPLVDHARAVLLKDVADRTRGTYELLSRFRPLYEQRQQREGALGFADVKHRLADAARTEELAELFYRLDGRIRHLLLDEFQDTALDEWRVVRPIAEEMLAQDEPDRSFFCVGDVKQAIYGWRGGVAEIFDALEARWPHLEIKYKDETRRCSPPIVETVNTVFGSLEANRPLGGFTEATQRWARRFRAHRPHFADRPGYAELRVGPEKEEGQRKATVPPDCTAEIVRSLRDRAPGRSIGVLVRTNDAVARLIYELRRLGVPASEEGGNPLTDSPAVAVVLSLLRLADHPDHTAAAYHVQQNPLGPIVGLGDLSKAARRRVSFQVRDRLLSDGYGPTIFGWTKQLAPHCNRRDLTRLLQLVELAHAYEPGATLRPGDFADSVEAGRVADPSAADVRVMTVHQAKGLEFDAVVLPELDKPIGLDPRRLVLTDRPDPLAPPRRISRYPSQAVRHLSDELTAMHAGEEADAVGEALCLLYVAMTRAKHALHLIVPASEKTGDKMPADFASLLRDALAPDQPAEAEAQLYESGDPDWHERTEAPQRPEPAAEPERPPAPRLAPSKGRGRVLPRRTPSQAGGHRDVQPAEVLRLDGDGRSFGTAMHAMFQRVGWVEDGLPGDEALRHAARVAAPGRDADGDLRAFHDALDQPAVRAALSRSAYPNGAGLRLLREHRFALRLDEELMTGSFDRLVMIDEAGDGQPDRAHVLDFKTDSFDPGDQEALAERTEQYRGQVEAYRRAAAELFGLDPANVEATLLFVSAGVAQSI